MKLGKTFSIGFIAGILATLIFTGLLQLKSSTSPRNILAQLEGEILTRDQLQKVMPPEWVLVENDEYRLLEQGTREWLEKRLLDREAKAAGISSKELYLKEIWSHVSISATDVAHYYNTNQALFNQPLEKLQPQLYKELRRREYERLKAEYLGRLREKYKAKIHLKRPRSYLEALAVPAVAFHESGEAAAPAAAPTPPSAAPAAAEAQGAPLSVPNTAPVRGPSQARVTIQEFADFHCGFCKRAAQTMKELLDNYPGKVRHVFRHHPLSETPGEGSFLTHEASVCAQDQGKFWEYHDAIFALPSTPSREDLSKMASQVGLKTSRFEDCLREGKHREFLKKELAEGRNLGINGTPHFYVNQTAVPGAYPYEHFVQVIQGILDPGSAPAPPAPTPPAVVQFDDLEGKPSQGPKNALITLVEFSDFHCPFCKKVTPTLDQLQKTYSGKIRRVWRHYPLPMHAGADRTHEASQCAHDQDKFWQYHDKLFETLGSARDDAGLIQMAKDLGLNQKKFESCLTTGKYKDLIQKEIAKGNQAGVRGTPATFINGQLVSGAQPYENFDQIIKRELTKS